MTKAELETTLSKSSRITVGFLLTVAALSIPVMIAAIGFLFSMTLSIHDLQRDVKALKASQYTKSQADSMAKEEAMANPGHRVPSPVRADKFHFVDPRQSRHSTEVQP